MFDKKMAIYQENTKLRKVSWEEKSYWTSSCDVQWARGACDWLGRMSTVKAQQTILFHNLYNDFSAAFSILVQTRSLFYPDKLW